MVKYIFITGGVVSSLGKGIAASGIGALLLERQFKLRIRKFDPYINIDPGTMNPYQHGECYVTDDGAETDLDLGHYERFTGVNSQKSDNITTGQIYQKVINKERRGDYLGKTVQVIPHITDEIKEFIASHTDDSDFIICEIGGTVGDIESLPFLEAIRQFANQVGRQNCCFIHVTLLPYIRSAGELKTKPTQHSVKELLSVGIQPDILLCRSEMAIPTAEMDKIALFCNVPVGRVFSAIDVQTIYQVPVHFHQIGLDKAILDYFQMPIKHQPDLYRWHDIIHRILHPESAVNIAIVGKYVGLKDAYKSLYEALSHGGIANNTAVNLTWLDAEELTQENIAQNLGDCDAILVPGGFGERGTEGKILAIEFARIHKIPFFGICFGMQMAVIEAAKNQANIKNASSSEFGACEHAVVGLLTEWTRGNEIETRDDNQDKGGTMRLGAYPCKLAEDSQVAQIYNSNFIHERHRHRYEVNIAYKAQLESVGLIFSGMSPDDKLPEIIERRDHPWFIGVQFHPELKSKPLNPHPLFSDFVRAALNYSRLV